MAITATRRKAKLRIIMNLEFADFDEQKRADFTHDLAAVLGCSVEDLANIQFIEGCVIGESDVDEVAVQLFLDLIQRNPDGTLTSSVREVREFLERRKVRNINADFTVPLQIRVAREAGQKVVFVHGWTGGSETFGKLPEYLGEKFDTYCEPFSYPTGLLSHSPSIFHVARGLENHIRTHVRAKSIGLVAHSMGGLVIRKMLILQRDHQDPLDQFVRQITFIASPHLGADIAAVATRIPLLSSKQLDELSPSSGFVPELRVQWISWLKRQGALASQVRSIYGTNDQVVTPSDAMGDDPEATPILGAGHKDIVKPRSPADPIVTTMDRFLREAGFSARPSRQDLP